MADNDMIFSVRGIVRGYQLFPDQGPLKELFLDDAEGGEVPVRLTGVDLPMRDGHDVEVFFVREDGAPVDVPLLVCNYSIRGIEEVRPPVVKQEGGNVPGCGVGLVGILLAVFLIGIGLFPAVVIGAVAWYLYRKVPVDKRFALTLRQRRHRQKLEAYIRWKYGGRISFDGRG